jgi:hypothetical protein
VDGDLLIRWTIRMAVALYAAVLFGWLLTPRGRSPRSWMRPAWTFGCLLALAHTACAFHLVHGWSHDAAYHDTARKTAELLGVAYGGGVYWNYAFLAVWLTDVLWWWTFPRRYLRRSFWICALVQGFLGFMVINGTVVFATGTVRWVAVAAGVGLGLSGLVTLATRAGASRQDGSASG